MQATTDTLSFVSPHRRARRLRLVAFAWLCVAPGPLANAGEVASDVVYESPGAGQTCGGPCNRLDVSLPAAASEGAVLSTTILYIHGGGWRTGSKASFIALRNVFDEAGYPVVSAGYTLSTPDLPSYPQAVHDVKAVVRWIRTAGAALYGLPSQIVVVGNSAGGHLALMLGVTADVARFEPLSPPPGGYRVSGVISLWGVSDLFTFDHPAVKQFVGLPFDPPQAIEYTEASPLTWASASDPPIALYHGLVDRTVPFEQSVRLHETLLGHGVYSELTLNPDAAHGARDWGGKTVLGMQLVPVVSTLLANDRDAADIDNDGDVDLTDLLLLVFAAGPCPDTGCPADLNGDGTVDSIDLELLLSP